MILHRANATGASLLLSLALMPACPPGEQVKGTGPVVKKEIVVNPFHGIQVDGSLDVVLTRTAVQTVMIEAQSNIAELVMTEVKNGIWHIRTSKYYSTEKPFVVHIGIPLIDHIHVNGSGDVKSTDTFGTGSLDISVKGSGDVMLGVEADAVNVSLSGSGEIKLSGSTTELQATVMGSGDIKAGNLRAQNATVHVTGSGDVAVDAVQLLDAVITGSGDVKYRSKPADIKAKVTGSGEVRASKE